MSDALRQILAGPRVPKTDPAYRAYQASLTLTARIKTAIWLVRTHPDSNLRTALREVRREISRRANAVADGFGPACSRMEPTLPKNELDELAREHRGAIAQAMALVGAPLDDLGADDAAAQRLALDLLRLAQAGR